MAWQIKDEWIDLQQARHTVIFTNPDTGAEHHLIHEFNFVSCPHCGQAQPTLQNGKVDFDLIIQATLAQLNAHHQKAMEYYSKHRTVRLGTGPK